MATVVADNALLYRSTGGTASSPSPVASAPSNGEQSDKLVGGGQLAVTLNFMSISRDRRSAIGSLDDPHADPPSHEFGNDIVDTARRKNTPADPLFVS